MFEGNSVVQEFKKFAMRGNVVDMAVGIVIGAAFGAIVKSLVDGVIMPPIGLLTSGIDFSDIVIPLGEGEEAATIKIGDFINSVINFLIVAFAIFMVIKAMNKMQKQEEEAPAKPPEPSAEEKLLAEIRDLLQKQS